jgi:hypothetical protein
MFKVVDLVIPLDLRSMMTSSRITTMSLLLSIQRETLYLFGAQHQMDTISWMEQPQAFM